MFVQEIVEAGVKIGWKHSPHTTKTVRKYRCVTGPRKGQVRSSPAACNAPYKYKAGIKLKQTKAKLGGHGRFTSRRTKKYNPGSRRLKHLNKPSRRRIR